MSKCKKRAIKGYICEEDCVWNPSAYCCENDKECKIDECLNNCTCMKSVFYNLVITCEDKRVNASTGLFDKKVILGIHCFFILFNKSLFVCFH